MTFIPAFEVCLDDSRPDIENAFSINPGQWVTCDGMKGRVVDPSSFKVIWRFVGESFRNFNLRFKRALMLRKGLSRLRGIAKQISKARQQLSLSLAVPESSELLSISHESVHREINSVRVRYDNCVKRGSYATAH